MIPRLLSCPLSLPVVLALAVATGAVSARPASAVTATVTYNIDNHDHLATVKNGAGKTLAVRRVATPTLRAVIDIQTVAAKSQPPALSLTLEDQNGLRLWSTPVLVPRQLRSVHSAQFNVKSSSDRAGTGFVFTFSTDSPGNPPNASDTQEFPAKMSLVCVLGAAGRLVSMNADSDGKQFNAEMGPKGITFDGPDGEIAHASVSANETGMTFDLNGSKVTAVKVKKDGEQYLSFPWNGHQVFVQDGCNFTVDSSGDLTVNAPVATADK